MNVDSILLRFLVKIDFDDLLEHTSFKRFRNHFLDPLLIDLLFDVGCCIRGQSHDVAELIRLDPGLSKSL